MEFGPKRGGGFEVRSSTLEVRLGSGIDQAAFEKAAEDAKIGCPVSSALKIEMSVKAGPAVAAAASRWCCIPPKAGMDEDLNGSPGNS